MILSIRSTLAYTAAITAVLMLVCAAAFAPLAQPAPFVATSYGPPWGGINGGGVTATGVDLSGSPWTYGVAVDPRVIPLGSRVRVWPNPFGCRRCVFRAFDTGGAIKGNRVDIYHPYRSVQLGWGRRTVDVYRVHQVKVARWRLLR